MRKMSDPSLEFVQKMFLDYYTRCFDQIHIPYLLEKREVGTLLFKGKMMVRHKAFRIATELQDFLLSVIPSDVYYSCAYYENPEAEMDRKGWLGADLIFDIDADHIPTLCGKVHDKWVCGNCNFGGKGLTPETCPICGGQKFDTKTWPCEVCLMSAKMETVKLLDMLMRDFAFSGEELHVFFSGHRGYHVHVENEGAKNLDASARKEIIDYISGLGLEVTLHGLGEKGLEPARVPAGPGSNESGWTSRVAKGIYDFVLNAKLEDYKNLGLKRNVAETIMKNKAVILMNRSNSVSLRAVKGVGSETWRKIAEFCAKNQAAKVDTVVTTDIHRLIRLGGTLHGKTGLKKVEIPVPGISDFDPFKSSIAFREETATVLVSEAPKFKLGDETFGPYKNCRVALPTAAALLLVCKDRAEVVD